MDKTLPPLNVSPLIKGARWGLLIAGIIYGASRQSMIFKREYKVFMENEKIKLEREARLAAEKIKIEKEQLEDLSKQLGGF